MSWLFPLVVVTTLFFTHVEVTIERKPIETPFAPSPWSTLV